MKKVRLFSDGSCLDNPGIGGWAYMIEYNGAIKTDSGAVADTTNNKMELLAAINGLAALTEPCEVELYTDSQYVQKGLNEWLGGWVAKDFRNIKNPTLWKKFYLLSKQHSIEAFWVKSHAGHPQNEECDRLARQAALDLKENLIKSGEFNDKVLGDDDPFYKMTKPKSDLGDPKLKKFQRILKYKFASEKLLREALTHKSAQTSYNNERLEFLGDAVLDLVVGEYLYNKFHATSNEGNLSKLRASLVNEESFAKLANLINLGDFLYLSASEENNGGRKKSSLLSDALEAVMGAIYLESGLSEVKRIFIKLLETEYKNIDLKNLTKDYKTMLQEYTQANYAQIPKYELILAKGPDHEKIFEMAVFLDDKKLAQAIGKSKKEAEQKAAKIAIEILEKR